MTKFIFLVIFSLNLYNKESSAKVAPNYITTCPGLTKECLMKAAQDIIPNFVKGIPAIGLESTDPMIIDHLELTLPGNFKVEFDNGTVHNLRKCRVEDIGFTNDEATLNLLCNVTIKGQYKASGSILIITINGEGDAKIRATNVGVRCKIKFHDVVRDGVTYYEIKHLESKHVLGDKITFALTNLFKGSPELSEAVLLFINENWKQLSEEFGGPIFEKVIELMFGVIRKFFEAIPKNEIFV